MSETKERSDDSELRGIVYHELLSHIKKAKEAGFYLEVITLFESLICDRLESRNSFLSDTNQLAFNTLGNNLKENRKLETDEIIKELTKQNGLIDNWRDKRNKSLHEMAKIEKGNERLFSEKYAELKDIASEGEVLFRKLDNQITKLRKSNK